ncbi:hypothetical protein FNV43_RR08509 [Rhamnella rubrinervis]|uniref:TIR domain-containing protein n=1 Tax=Rhamnella rubrinervis TaxID=2594499 RepID=A0A8K0H8W7_9ROSA|nr:hypothetical protein FNV43_RR08509 [Rhamnella rubrinervis]
MEKITNSYHSSSSSPRRRKKYDVFLSYRGEDTGLTFTSHLYGALRRKGISNTYMDVEELKKGKDIEPQLMNAIENSDYAIIVLSKKYATSTWCLKEVAKIVECMGDSGRIRTIFYHLGSHHARLLKSAAVEKQQKSCFWQALEKHAEDPSHSEELISSWKNALVTVAFQYDLLVEKKHTNEEKFIEDFIAELSRKVGASTKTLDGLVGITSRISQLNSCVLRSSTDICFIGIHGVGGIGKSTLATYYFNEVGADFDGRSFLSNVKETCERKENGLVDLQKQLLSDILGEKGGSFSEIGHVDSGKNMIKSRLCNIKVLVVLDDVSKLEQLDAIAGSHEKKNGLDHDELDKWFGPGSRIIVTTRYKDLLNEKYEKYEVEHLSFSEALELFSLKSFGSKEPPDEYKELSEQAVRCAEYLPLALNVFASLLRSKKNVNEWTEALTRLENYPAKEIVDKLKISYDDLDATDQRIFLDIACSFKGHDRDDIIPILDSCGFNSKHGIDYLVGRSLLEIRYGKILWMRDLLQQMGRDIVRRESSKPGGRPSRIWDVNELKRILGKKTGLEKVEAIVVNFEKESRMSRFVALSNMEDLRLLKIHGSFAFQAETDGSTPTLDSLSNDLKFLEWDGFPFTKFPASFEPYGLVELKLIESNLQQLWNNYIELPNLKVIDLKDSKYFRTFKDFSVVPNLERLILKGCIELLEIDPSITLLEWLTILNLENCTSLKKLPPSMKGLNSLECVNLYGCRKLCHLPEDIGDLRNLKELDVRESGMDPALSKMKDCDVFLSFRDTRHALTDHLRCALHRKGICYFNDADFDIERGQLIPQAIMDVIQRSRISVVVLSENYAFSRRCLRELWKIVECMDKSGLDVVPIFYHVNQSDVRNLDGCFRDAFENHKNNPMLHFEEVETWKDALKRVGNLPGWTLGDM